MSWRGRAASKSIDRGHLKAARCSRQNASSSASISGPGALRVEQLHDGLHLLAEVVVGHAEHRDVGHRGWMHEHVLGLLRVDVHAAADDREALAVGEVEVAVVVEVADVAEVEPALRAAALGRLLGVAVVLEARRRGLEPDVADLADRQLVVVVVADVDGGHRAACPTEPGWASHSSGPISVEPTFSEPA